MDGVIPACQTEAGCKIPPLLPAGTRVVGIRDKIVRLHNLVDSGTILRMFEADLDDLELLAILEDEIRAEEERKDKGGDNG